MKKPIQHFFFGIMLITACAVVFSACGAKEIDNADGTANSTAYTAPYSTAQIAEILVGDMHDIPPLLPLYSTEDYFSDYLSAIYALEGSLPDEGALYYANGAYATEIAVFLFADAESAAAAKESLSLYKTRRENVFAGYAPEQAKMLADGLVVTHGPYVALLVCPDPLAAESVFLSCFSDTPPLWHAVLQPIPADEAVSNIESAGTEANAETEDVANAEADVANAEADVANAEADAANAEADAANAEADAANAEADAANANADADVANAEADAADADAESPPRYGHNAILAAWVSGDASALTEKDKLILEAASAVIEAQINADMGDYEKELAIHNWMVAWADYDAEALSNAPDASPDPDNDNPFGLLLHKRAICSGYTYTFQLFMDMLGIECVTVHGASGDEEHAWNMVRLDGQWYCVDVTWDDPISLLQTEAMRHRYFNVSSAFMRDNKHQWDESTAPVASSPKLYH